MTAVVRRLSGDSLLLIAPNGSKILVNCQEGCQRSFLEYAQRLSTVSCICLASARVEHAGGLPGALLTVLDSSNNNNNNNNSWPAAAGATEKENNKGIDKEKLVHVIGPSPSTKALLSSLRHFMNLRKRVVVVEPTTTTTTTTIREKGEPPEEEEEIVFATSFYSIRMLMPQQQRRRQQQQQQQQHEPMPQEHSEEDSSPLRKRPRTCGSSDHHDAAAKVTNSGGTTTTSNNTSNNNNTIKASFVFQTPRVPGKFQPDRARALGVPKGPLFAQLCKGQSVTLADGTVVASHQVMTADAPPLSIVVLHYHDDVDDDTDEDNINDELLRLARAAVTDTTVELVVHMVPHRALYERYRMKMMWPDDAVRHQCHVYDAPHTFRTARRAAHVRSLLCASVYAKIDDHNHDDDDDNDNDTAAIGAPAEDLDHQVRWEYTLLPRRSAGWKAILDNDDDNNGDDDDMGPMTAETLVESTGALALAHSIILQQQQQESPLLPTTTTTTINTNDPVAVVDGALPSTSMENNSDDDHHNNNDNEAITFLGTGCAIPCKYRNVSGIYIAPHGLALDAGEGTWAQMRAMALHEPPRIVWISHPHADHHLGLLTLLRQQVRLVCRQQQQEQQQQQQDPNEDGRRNHHPILVIAPTQLKLFLQEYCESVDASMAGAYEFIETCSHRPLVLTEAQARRLADCGITAVHAVKVAHCNQAFAGVFDTTSRWRRLVYSGDCRPSQALQQDWPNCHVLIHEATFADDLVAEAVLKKHSTVSEAVAVGKAMKARHVILTHFSQRYPKAPPPFHDDGNVVFAHDYMRLTPNILPLAKAITSALRKFYPEEAIVADKDATTDLGEKSSAEVLLATPGLFADPKMLLHS